MRFGWIRSAVASTLISVVAFAIVLVIAPVVSALPGETAVQRFGGCLAAQGSGQMLLLIDESSSLKSSDPEANRVKAAKYLAQQLLDYSNRTGVRIDVAVSGFSSGFNESLGWTKLETDSLPQVESGLDAYRDRNNGTETDYWTALDGARAELASSPKPSEGPRCQALAWFTDGKLDFGTSASSKPFAPDAKLDTQEGVDETIAAAQESICRPRGVADQLRSSGIATFAIGLAPQPEQASDFDLMKAIATGQPAGPVSSCGAITSPVPGEFYLAQNIEDLLFAFDKFGIPDQPPIETDTGACPRVICEEAKHRFVLDRSVRSVSVLAAADRPGLVPYLIAPDGATLDMSAGPETADLGGVSVDWKPQSDKAMSFRMSGSTSPTWQGVWALVFVDPAGDPTARTRSSIHIAGDLVPAWPDAASTTLRNKESATFTFAVVDGTGKPVDTAGLLGQATFSASLVDSAGTEHPIVSALPKDQITAPHTVELADVPPGAATLHLSLDITTADATDSSGAPVPGTRLTPQRVDLPVSIAAPAGYPTAGQLIDFGEHEGAGPLTGELKVTGPGCVWLADDAENTVAGAPDGVGDITLSSTANSRDTCLKLAEGEEKSLPITMTVPAPGTGAANGTVAVTLGPDVGDGEPVTVPVDYTASLKKPLDTKTFTLALITALLLGPGLPLALLYLSKWMVSRIPNRGLRAQQIPVRVTGDAVLRDHRPFAVEPGELNNLVAGLERPARRLDLGQGVELRARMGLAPFGGGYVVAQAPGRAGAAGRSAEMTGKTPDAKLPLAVHNSWFVLHDPTGPAEFATVVLLASSDADGQVVNRLTDEVATNLPRVLGILRQRATPGRGASPNVQPDNPFGGTGGPGGPGANPFGGPAGDGGNPFDGPGGSSGNPFGGPAGPTGPAVGGNPFGNPGGPDTQPNPSRPAGNPFGQPGPAVPNPPPPPQPPPGGNPFA